MAVRGPGDLVINDKNFGNRQVETDRRNFEIGNTPGGYQGQVDSMRAKDNVDAQRTGPVMDRGQSMADLQASRGARAQEDALAEALRGQAYGTGYNPAVAQLRAGAQQAQAQQRSIAAGQTGYDAAGANRAAAFQGSVMNQQTGQQARVLQAQQMAFGRDQYGALAEALRGQDLAQRDAMQQDAARQAALEDDQRARNDAMSQFYLSEQGRLRRGQTAANINFEQQDAANRFGVSNLEAGRRAFDQQQDNRYVGMTLGGGGSLMAAGTTLATSPTEEQRQRRNPYDPYKP